MINWGRILEFITQHTSKLLFIPLTLCSITFIANMIMAMTDGTIDEQEFHSLLQHASSTEMIILAIVMAVLKIRSK